MFKFIEKLKITKKMYFIKYKLLKRKLVSIIFKKTSNFLNLFFRIYKNIIEDFYYIVIYLLINLIISFNFLLY